MAGITSMSGMEPSRSIDDEGRLTRVAKIDGKFSSYQYTAAAPRLGLARAISACLSKFGISFSAALSIYMICLREKMTYSDCAVERHW